MSSDSPELTELRFDSISGFSNAVCYCGVEEQPLLARHSIALTKRVFLGQSLGWRTSRAFLSPSLINFLTVRMFCKAAHRSNHIRLLSVCKYYVVSWWICTMHSKMGLQNSIKARRCCRLQQHYVLCSGLAHNYLCHTHSKLGSSCK